MADRRSFLRGLVSLPLIGGGVTLVGQPTAAAVPVSSMLVERYALFLADEAREAFIEAREMRHLAQGYPERAAVVRDHLEQTMWAPSNPWIHGLLEHQRPSARAAVILSAAGVPLPLGGAS